MDDKERKALERAATRALKHAVRLAESEPNVILQGTASEGAEGVPVDDIVEWLFRRDTDGRGN